jgi:hypothetical protein
MFLAEKNVLAILAVIFIATIATIVTYEFIVQVFYPNKVNLKVSYILKIILGIFSLLLWILFIYLFNTYF